MHLSDRDFRRGLRRSSTPAERRLWSELRDRRLGGLKFRRQHHVGPYVLDFYCHSARLAVEVDGAVHDDPLAAAYDAGRTAALGAEGVRVIRFSNEEVWVQLDVVVASVLNAATNPPHPVPLPLGEGTL